MKEYTKEALRVVLEQQTTLFGDRVANTVHEAKEFLEENMAEELNSLQKVKEYLVENGMDISGMPDEEVLDQDEVIQLPSGRFLVVPL